MNALTLVFACLIAFAAASVGHHGGAIVSGPSGIVTSHGAIGPADHGIGHVGVIGHGVVGHGIGAYGYGVGAYGHGGHGAAIIAPVATAVVAGPAVVGHGIGYGYGIGHGIGHGIGYGIGHGIGHGIGYGHDDGVVAIGHHGVAVQGPHTAPAVIAGPSGKIVADGLWGPTSHWAHGGHHGW